MDKTRLKMQVWFFLLAIWLLFHILNFVGFRLNNCRCDQSTLTHTLLINERAAETPIIRPKSTKLGIEKAFGDDIGNIIEWKLTSFSRWIQILSERKTYTYNLDAFFCQIKSFRRFCLALGLGVRPFIWLILVRFIN